MQKATLYDGREMLVLIGDDGISLELLTDKVHEESCTEFIKTVIKPGMQVIDIGANIGYYAFLELGLVGLDGFVYAIEPVPRNIACLEENIELYNYTNIRPFQIALGFENTLVEMKLTNFSNTGTIVKDEQTSDWYKDWFSNWHTENIVVEQWSLDDFREVYKVPVPDLIRMDVEGYEVDVISGAQKTLAEMNKRSHLFIELHPPIFKHKLEVMGKLIQNLYSHGFGPIWADGLTKFEESFTSWVCDDRHCPHVFFEKQK